MNSKSLLSRRSIRIGMCLQAVNMIDCKNNMRAFEGMNKTVTVSPCLVFLLFRSIADTAFLETRSYIEVKADEVTAAFSFSALSGAAPSPAVAKPGNSFTLLTKSTTGPGRDSATS